MQVNVQLLNSASVLGKGLLTPTEYLCEWVLERVQKPPHLPVI